VAGCENSDRTKILEQISKETSADQVRYDVLSLHLTRGPDFFEISLLNRGQKEINVPPLSWKLIGSSTQLMFYDRGGRQQVLARRILGDSLTADDPRFWIRVEPGVQIKLRFNISEIKNFYFFDENIHFLQARYSMRYEDSGLVRPKAGGDRLDLISEPVWVK
jgi:hypothetical protein